MEYPDAVPLLFSDRTRGLTDLNKIRLYIKSTGKWRIMNIDDSLPCGLKDLKPLYSQVARKRDMPPEAWLPLLEKAFATLVGGYPGLNGGQPWAALEAMTGDPVVVHAFDDAKQRWASLKTETDLVFGATPAGIAAASSPPEVVASYDVAEMWGRLVSAYRQGHIIALTTEGIIASGQADRQAYAVIEVHEIGNVRLLGVRNPWGTFRWKGDWSHSSELWDQRQDVLDAVNPVFESESEFYITIEDVAHAFHQLLIVQRGSTKSSSLKFLTQAAFTEGQELARQGGVAVAARRAQIKSMHGVQSCLPRSRNYFQSIGAAAGSSIYRAGAFINRCASVARKNSVVPPFPFGGRAHVASSADAATTLDGGGDATGAGPAPGSLSAALGAPAAGGTVIGRPVRAAVAAIRSYWRPDEAAASTGGEQPQAPSNAPYGTVLGYAVPMPGPVTVMRAYWRREPAANGAAAAVPHVATSSPDGVAQEMRRGGGAEPGTPTSP